MHVFCFSFVFVYVHIDKFKYNALSFFFSILLLLLLIVLCFPLTVGDHGYDNSLRSMHPFLAAHGPAFRKGYRMESIKSVDLYPLMCHVLGIPEMPNNGSFLHTRCMLVSEKCTDLAVVVGIVIGVFIVLTTITFLFRLMKNRESSSRPFARLELQEDDDDDDPLLE